MFTFLELTSVGWNPISVGLNILADFIFFGSLWWAYHKHKDGE